MCMYKITWLEALATHFLSLLVYFGGISSFIELTIAIQREIEEESQKGRETGRADMKPRGYMAGMFERKMANAHYTGGVHL